jgi:dUTP pyrophosphatase
MKQTMPFTKTRDVKSPSRAHASDAGIDFYIPADMPWESFTIQPNTSLLIDAGIRMHIPVNTALIAFEKSGVAKRGLTIGARVVDSGYTGNIHIHLINTSKQPVTVSRSEKIAQFILLPVILVEPIEIDQNQYDLFEPVSARGAGGFGSTDNL